MAKKIDLGVSRGPSKSERATIAKGEKKVEVHYGSDSEPEKVDPRETARQASAEKTRVAQNEIDADVSAGKKSGRIQRELTTVPGADHPNRHVRDMSKHSAAFISAGISGNKGAMEAARTGFWSSHGAARGVPQGTNIEKPCSTPGCSKTIADSTRASKGRAGGGTTCGDAGCGAGPNVQRPRG